MGGERNEVNRIKSMIHMHGDVITKFIHSYNECVLIKKEKKWTTCLRKWTDLKKKLIKSILTQNMEIRAAPCVIRDAQTATVVACLREYDMPMRVAEIYIAITTGLKIWNSWYLHLFMKGIKMIQPLEKYL